MYKSIIPTLLMMCLAILPIRADYAPSHVQAALKKLCPQAIDITWQQSNNHYIAQFEENNFDVEVWFNKQGEWLMKQTDWGNMDEVPSAIFNAYSMGEYSDYEVKDVIWVEYPQQDDIIALIVSEPNEETTYQLLYSSNGELIDTRDVTYLSNQRRKAQLLGTL
ncbi:MAG: hypothetical protein E7099_03000 [Mediterranea massiliensis]|nr:hypothetical protein [Mediterranea massiliensis]